MTDEDVRATGERKKRKENCEECRHTICNSDAGADE
jgi:hypothetical protein